LKNFKSDFDVSDEEGTIFGSIAKDDLHGLKVVYSEEVIRKFDLLVKPLDEQIKNYSKQIETIEMLKDLLLAKLTSSEH
jgi:type I restriction enzyme S subunit